MVKTQKPAQKKTVKRVIKTVKKSAKKVVKRVTKKVKSAKKPTIKKKAIRFTKVAEVKCNWLLTVGQIKSRTKSLIKRCKVEDDRIAKIPLSQVSINNVLIPTARLAMEESSLCEELCFPSHVSPDKALRDASTAASKALSAFSVESMMRVDVFLRFNALLKKGVVKDPMDLRWLERTVRDYKRSGLDLPKEIRDQVETKKKRMSTLSTDYATNTGEENRKLEFTKAELKGLPDDFLNKLEKKKDKFIVSLKYPHVFPVLKLCSVSSTRQTMEKAFNSRCIETNVAIIEELVVLRAEVASILGYKNHAEYILEVRMAKNPNQVKKFLGDLSAKLKPLQTREMKELEVIKKKMEPKSDGKLTAYDGAYYRDIQMKQKYNLDQEIVKQYFPADVVFGRLLSLYEHLLHLVFTEIENPQIWAPGVRMFSVHDRAGTGPFKGKLMGYFYLDLFPRQGKYGHAACFTLQQGCSNLDPKNPDARQMPVAACVCNFPEPSKGMPSLLTHSDVVTFFHEFGHVMHVMCANSKYIKFGGTRVERDFVEAPSQMLENFCWEKSVLQQISSHYKTGEPLSDAMCDKIAATKDVNAGILNMRQILFGTLDQTIHTASRADAPKVSTADVLEKLTWELTGVKKTQGTNFAASFGHLAGGYDAQYYGYLWSQVFSADMFASVFMKAADGPFDSTAGLKYRRCILQPGGSRDAVDMLRDFLGRNPTQTAFLQGKGVKL